jgi:hypothetical protein
MRRRRVRVPTCSPVALRVFLSLSVLIGWASHPVDLLAGPNEGGVLLVHYSPTAAVPNEPTFVDSGLAACAVPSWMRLRTRSSSGTCTRPFRPSRARG